MAEEYKVECPELLKQEPIEYSIYNSMPVLKYLKDNLPFDVYFRDPIFDGPCALNVGFSCKKFDKFHSLFYVPESILLQLPKEDYDAFKDQIIEAYNSIKEEYSNG